MTHYFKMRRKEALSIVDTHVLNDLRGTGQGIRKVPSWNDGRRATEALEILFRAVHGRKPVHGELGVHQF